jgi:hypothetical protein
LFSSILDSLPITQRVSFDNDSLYNLYVSLTLDNVELINSILIFLTSSNVVCAKYLVKALEPFKETWHESSNKPIAPILA